MNAAAAQRGAAFCLLALVALGLAWELVLAPLRPGGSWLALKVLPLLWIAPGILRGRRYTYQGATMLVLVYFAEGAVRSVTDRGLSAQLAMGETVLTLAFFALAIAYVRATRTLK